jgi:hypothetical protein
VVHQSGKVSVLPGLPADPFCLISKPSIVPFTFNQPKAVFSDLSVGGCVHRSSRLCR